MSQSEAPGLPWRDLAGVSAAAALLTLVLAVPVLHAPSERIFGAELVGRHFDPFTMMQSFGNPVHLGVYSQPATDLIGALLARIVGRVASYNVLVLLTFPLAAAAAYALARHLALSRAAAAVVAFAFAFSPFHLAQAAYHVHIAQTQWIPLYLLALWRCLDRSTPAAVVFLCASVVGVTLSNFYGGLIAALLTPVAIPAYWLMRRSPGRRLSAPLWTTLAALAVMAAGGIGYLFWAAPSVAAQPASYAWERGDLAEYGARWWSYLIPAAVNPWAGRLSRRLLTGAGVSTGLLEQQVAIGWAFIALAAVAAWGWLTRSRRAGATLAVPALAAIGLAAFICSLSPDDAVPYLGWMAPAQFIHPWLPMFRSYARFGVLVQLAVVLLAGIGIDRLRASGRAPRAACGALLLLAAAEYAVWPGALWRDTLPTAAHRWMAGRTDAVRAFDCAPLTWESASITWLTGDKVTLLADREETCAEPNLAGRLAASGYTHVIVRAGWWEQRWLASHARDEGLQLRARFADGDVWAIVEPAPLVYTAQMSGFLPREMDGAGTWRWMRSRGTWTVVNRGAAPLTAKLEIEMSAFRSPQPLEIHLDGRRVGKLIVSGSRRLYAVGSLVLTPGTHQIAFAAAGAATDPDALSVAVGDWAWTARERVRGMR